MKGILTLKKSTIIATVCLAVLCLPGYSEPTPEQIAERTRLLESAIHSNNLEQAKLCIKLGADVNAHFVEGIVSRDFSLVSYAADQGYKDLTELLIEAGADVNAKNGRYNYDRSALMLAAQHGYKEIAEVLIKAGTDVNAKDSGGRTALMWAISNDYDGGSCKETMEVLIKAGADVNAKDNDGKTALMWAINDDYVNSCKETAELLIKAGADVNAKNNNGWTALMLAASMYSSSRYSWNKDNNYKDVTELLIKSGADGNATLIWAVKKDRTSTVELLIELGVNPNTTDSEGISALDNAILYGKDDIADLLRAAGAKE